MELKQVKYETIECGDEEEYLLVGNITMKDGTFHCAEIIDDLVYSEEDIENVRVFLNIVEEKMKNAI